jgi:hypothetical protein
LVSRALPERETGADKSDVAARDGEVPLAPGRRSLDELLLSRCSMTAAALFRVRAVAVVAARPAKYDAIVTNWPHAHLA